MYGARAEAGCSGELWAAADNDSQSGEWGRVPASVFAKVNRIEVVAHEPGLSTNLRRVNGGGNSGYQAIGLAYLWGATRIILLGYDMQKTGGKLHHHGKHEGGLPNLGNLTEWARRMIQLGIDLRKQNVRVINATRETAITCFERMPIEDALR